MFVKSCLASLRNCLGKDFSFQDIRAGFIHPGLKLESERPSRTSANQTRSKQEDQALQQAYDPLSLKLALVLRLYLTVCPLIPIIDMITNATVDWLTMSALLCLCASMLLSALLLSLEHVILAQVFSTMGLMATSLSIALFDTNNMTSLIWLVLIPLDALLFLQNMNLWRAMLLLVSGVTLVIAYLMSGFGPNNFAGNFAGNFSSDFIAQNISAMGYIVPAFVFCCLFVLGLCVLSQCFQRDMRHAKSLYSTLVATTGDDVLICDKYGDVMTVCTDERNVMLSMSDLATLSLFERVHIADRPAFLKSLSDAMNQGGVIMTRLRLNISQYTAAKQAPSIPVQDYKSSQSFTWIEMRTRALDDQNCLIDEAYLNKTLLFRDSALRLNQNPPALIMSLRNIDSFIAHEEQMEAAKLEAQQANALKDRLLANVSHELRTPLNAIIGFSELLGSPVLAPKDPLKQREYANIIHASSQHLLSVVNSILDMSKIEAGSFEIITEAFEVQEFVTSCCDIVRLRAEEKSITLCQQIAANVAPDIIADKRACKQILINLLSNAVKFTPEGGTIHVLVQQEGNYVCLNVIDTGIGIASQDMAKLGDAFFQARASYDRPYEGTGLGLSVVRGLVGLHGGSMSVESEQGQGTHVSVTLPVDCRKSANRFLSPVKIETITRKSLRPPNVTVLAVGASASGKAGRKSA